MEWCSQLDPPLKISRTSSNSQTNPYSETAGGVMEGPEGQNHPPGTTGSLKAIPLDKKHK